MLRSIDKRDALQSGMFFFSSRRRHTRCSRDWSSDVCSSDLSGVVAFTTISAPPISFRCSVTRMLWSIFSPRLTMAQSTSLTPSAVRVSGSVASAWTAWVARPCRAWTFSAALSMTMTSLSPSKRVSATAEPKVPAPMTANRRIPAASFGKPRSSYHDVFLGIAEFSPGLQPSHGGGHREGAYPAHQHYQNQNELSKDAQARRDPGGKPDGAEGRDHFEEDLDELLVALWKRLSPDLDEGEGRDRQGHERKREDQHRERLRHRRARHAPV